VWSERYDRAFTVVFAVQDEIARAIVDKLDVELPGRRTGRLVPSGNRNIEAYNLYLRGRHLANKYTKEGMQNGMACFSQALEIDPDYAEVHAELGHCFVLFAIFSAAAPRAVMPMALASIRRALAINPDLAVAQGSLAAARFWYEWDWAGAEEAYRRSIALAPGNSWMRHGYSFFLSLQARHDEAIAMARAAQQMDPVSPLNSLAVASTLCNARRFDEAAREAEHLLALEPSFFSTYWALALAQAGQGRIDDAIATLERGRTYAHGDAIIEGFLGWAYGLAGRHDEAREIVRQLEARRGAGYLSGTYLGLVYQGLGDMDEAIKWYRTAVEDRATDCTAYGVSPHFDPIRQDARFRDLVAYVAAGGPESR
jgi:tetratricopeptide (TPR) repeat protein